MRLQEGGIDVFYIDESGDRNVFLMTAVCIPLLRNVDSTWTFQWHDYLDAAKEWRRKVRLATSIPLIKELHGSKLASGRGRYKAGKYSFTRPEAAEAYRAILSLLGFLPDYSVMSVVATPATSLYGHSRLEAALYALFQRIRVYCHKNNRNALVFFDEGHDEYRHLYRRSVRYLPTGFRYGRWETGTSSKNLPLDMFVEDGNIKSSRHSLFVQIADLIAYVATMKIRSRSGTLAEWQHNNELDSLYDDIPNRVLNVYATNKAPRDAIVRL